MPSTPPAAAVPTTMRAWVRQRRGPARSALELVSNLPTPDMPTGASPDVLIRVSHVSLQFNSELFLKLLPKLPFAGPWIPELELSGEVVAAGDGAPAGLRAPGTHVIGFQSVGSAVFLGRGVLAEYVRLPGNQAVPVDGTVVDMAAVSGINCSGSTALKMIRTSGVQRGDTVLINGASGSVGSVLVQLCKLRGVKVVAVASGANEAMVRALGADEFIDYRQHESLPAYLAQHYGDKPFDFILDCVGTQALFVQSPAYLKAEGALVNIGAIDGVFVLARQVLFNLLLPTWLGGVPRRYIMFSTPPTRDDAMYLARLMEEGNLRVPVDSVFDLTNAVDAYERVATKRARGKVIIKVSRE
ncbi:Alcohol dehydrogenase superfamily, zinc-type [Niveomyces insectorum RCEF 264]|uniref:Alcohol dehydrogenase superfamily, zinc-type n=1 Tax=Niveomyces insectorum RCEF 264 TaxID=1081102 RepID=A0A167MHQ2_9HYPO|nr:Alcohol dehydrogenase superfamily, zinc-type [Niveomyces insectorum RCEF 264]